MNVSDVSFSVRRGSHKIFSLETFVKNANPNIEIVVVIDL